MLLWLVNCHYGYLMSGFLQYVYAMQLLRNRLVSTARKCMGQNASLGQVYGSMQEAYQQMQTPLIHQAPSALVR